MGHYPVVKRFPDGISTISHAFKIHRPIAAMGIVAQCFGGCCAEPPGLRAVEEEAFDFSRPTSRTEVSFRRHELGVG